MSNTYEICFTGQIDSTSPEDVDFILQIEVTDVVNTKGNFSRLAETPEEFYGEMYLEWEVYSGTFSEECYDVGEGMSSLCEWVVQGDGLEEIQDKYQDKIEELLWEAIDEEREDSYDPPEPYDYPEEDWK